MGQRGKLVRCVTFPATIQESQKIIRLNLSNQRCIWMCLEEQYLSDGYYGVYRLKKIEMF